MNLSENEISRIIVGNALMIHKQLGPGLLESVYEEFLYYFLIKKGLNVQKQKALPVISEGIRLECGFRCDLVIENKVIIEIKSVEEIHRIHLAQVLTYLKLTNYKLGLIINFNVLRIKDGIKRVVNGL